MGAKILGVNYYNITSISWAKSCSTLQNFIIHESTEKQKAKPLHRYKWLTGTGSMEYKATLMEAQRRKSQIMI